jgi:hypothetical protein
MPIWTTEQNDFVVSNLNSLGNKALAFILCRTPMAIKNCMARNGISRDLAFQKKMVSTFASARTGDKNPCWKGGISQNHYHYKLIQIKRYPERVNAREAVQTALRSGILTKQPCEICATTKNIQAHHEDYAVPLDVKWLCGIHHRDADRARRRREKSANLKIIGGRP